MGWLDDVIAEGMRNAQRAMLEEEMMTGRPSSAMSGAFSRAVRPKEPSVKWSDKVQLSTCRTCWGTGIIWCYGRMKCPFCDGVGLKKSLEPFTGDNER